MSTAHPATLHALHSPAGDPAALLENAPVPLLQLDGERQVCWANAAARDLLGPAARPGAAFSALAAADDDMASLCAQRPAQARLALRADMPGRVQASAWPVPEGGWLLALQVLPWVHGEGTVLPPMHDRASAAEAHLALAADLAGVGLWRHDLATDLLHYDAQSLRILDLPPQDAVISAARVRDMVHPEDQLRLHQARGEVLAGGAPQSVQARFRRADGSWRTVITRRVPQFGPQGEVVAYLGVALDATDYIRLSRRSDDMTRRFELVTRTAGIGWWVSQDGAERPVWSEPLRRIFGLAAQAPVPRLREWLQTHVHPDDRAAVREAYLELFAGRRTNVELGFRIRRQDGQVRHLFAHSQFEPGAGAPTLFGVVVDLTEQNRSALALRSASERAALAARGAGLGTWEIDCLTGEVRWDEQMWRLRGQQPLSRAMTFDERLACVHPDDRKALIAINEAAVSQTGALEHEFRVVWPDGSVRWLASRSVDIVDESTGISRRIGVNWDITDRRTADTVRREREIARHESEAKSKFLARMSHELRTPLNAVLGFAQLLINDETSQDAAALRRRRRLGHIHSAGQHLLSLINDVLDLASLQGGEMRIEMQDVPLAPLVLQTLPLLGTLLDERKVSVHCGALDATVRADATRLRQVLINLLSNAIKYNRPGGRVQVEALARGGGVLLRVSDTGRGMSDEQMRHLFEPFNRLGQDGESIEGTGIGLAIVKALTERMGGSVHVDSTLGQGSVFELRLPMAGSAASPTWTVTPPPAVLPDPTAADSAAPVARRRVLYIEDNPVNALIIAELLARRSDLVLHIAEDGASGVAQAIALQPALILLDMQLPDCDGFEVLRRLRADPVTATIPCVALSANAVPEDIDRALRAGMAAYWTKPLDFRAFMASLDGLFGPT